MLGKPAESRPASHPLTNDLSESDHHQRDLSLLPHSPSYSAIPMQSYLQSHSKPWSFVARVSIRNPLRTRLFPRRTLPSHLWYIQTSMPSTLNMGSAKTFAKTGPSERLFIGYRDVNGSIAGSRSASLSLSSGSGSPSPGTMKRQALQVEWTSRQTTQVLLGSAIVLDPRLLRCPFQRSLHHSQSHCWTVPQLVTSNCTMPAHARSAWQTCGVLWSGLHDHFQPQLHWQFSPAASKVLSFASLHTLFLQLVHHQLKSWTCKASKSIDLCSTASCWGLQCSTLSSPVLSASHQKLPYPAATTNDLWCVAGVPIPAWQITSSQHYCLYAKPKDWYPHHREGKFVVEVGHHMFLSLPHTTQTPCWKGRHTLCPAAAVDDLSIQHMHCWRRSSCLSLTSRASEKVSKQLGLSSSLLHAPFRVSRKLLPSTLFISNAQFSLCFKYPISFQAHAMKT